MTPGLSQTGIPVSQMGIPASRMGIPASRVSLGVSPMASTGIPAGSLWPACSYAKNRLNQFRSCPRSGEAWLRMAAVPTKIAVFLSMGGQ